MKFLRYTDSLNRTHTVKVADDYEMTRDERKSGAEVFTLEEHAARKKTGWVQTVSGLPFWPLEPDYFLIEFPDISHHLASKVRYSGAGQRHYSIAEHSVHMSQWAKRQCFDKSTQMWMLLHDASEFILPDVARPYKADLTGFAEIEAGVMTSVIERFNSLFWVLPFEEPSIVKYADTCILHNEREANMAPPPLPWGIKFQKLDGVIIQCWSREAATVAWLAEFKRIVSGA